MKIVLTEQKTKPEQGDRRLSRTHNSSKETAYGSTRVKKTHEELVVFRRDFKGVFVINFLVLAGI